MGILVIYVDKLRIVVPILQIHSNSFPFANMLLYIANAESPVILRDTAGRRVIVTFRLNSPRPFPPIVTATSRNATRHGRGEIEEYFTFFSALILSAIPRNAILAET